jgi:hypothetical protein
MISYLVKSALILIIALIPTKSISANRFDQYFNYAKFVADHYISDLAQHKQNWRNAMQPNGRALYNPSGNDIYLAALCANLYEITKEEKYLDAAAELLNDYGQYKKRFDANQATFKRIEYNKGLPAIPDFFVFPKYVHAYSILKKSAKYTPQKSKMEQHIIESADYHWRTQEWGPMNRAMLRAEGLLYAASVIPNHPAVQTWKSMGYTILQDNVNHWSMEDASMYNAIWLYSLMGYSMDVAHDSNLLLTPYLRYYYNFFKALLSPAGQIPDYGDAHWKSRWVNFVAFFEVGSYLTGDPELAWAANQIWQANNPVKTANIVTAMVLSDMLRWCPEQVPVKMPVSTSQEVLDDHIGKKIVFRNGWEPSSAYTLLNYRDEGDGNWLYRENLRTTLSVEEEKMHHGHADENSLILYMHDGDILLHDGGYRTLLPSGPLGAYRADYYHNRIVVRNHKISTGQMAGGYKFNTSGPVPGQNIPSFFAHSGAYRPVETRKIEFYNAPYVDMSRTRLIDVNTGYQSDRILYFLKKEGIIVALDIVKFLRQDYFTLGNFWYSRQIHAQGSHWFDTSYDSLRNESLAPENRLLVYFMDDPLSEVGSEEEDRYYQKEHLLYQVRGRHAFTGEVQLFATILIPHDKNIDPETLIQLIDKIVVNPEQNVAAFQIQLDDHKYVLSAKIDLQKDYARDWRRPKYDWASGKRSFGAFTTDAQHFSVMETKDSIHYGATNLTAFFYQNNPLFQAYPQSIEFNFDGSPPQSGTWKVRATEGSIPKHP